MQQRATTIIDPNWIYLLPRLSAPVAGGEEELLQMNKWKNTICCKSVAFFDYLTAHMLDSANPDIP